ncbi:MAG: DUF2877 domain-containing protein [Thermaerobacterales bacterium]
MLPFATVVPSEYARLLLNRLGSAPLRIHSVYRHTANIQVGRTLLLALTDDAQGRSPFGLAVAGPGAGRLLSFLSRHVGAAVSVNIGERCLLLGRRPLAAWNAATACASRLPASLPAGTDAGPVVTAARFHEILQRENSAWTSGGRGLGEMLDVWEPGDAGGPRLPAGTGGGQAESLSLWTRRAIPVIGPLIRRPLSELPEQARRLIGLGIGSTPSGDDVLLGLMVILRNADQAGGNLNYPAAAPAGVTARPHHGLHRLQAAVLRQAVKHTHLISFNYLFHAAQGRYSSHITSFLQALTQGNGANALDQAVRKVLRVGSTSGWDTLIGILAGLYRLEAAETGTTRVPSRPARD